MEAERSEGSAPTMVVVSLTDHPLTSFSLALREGVNCIADAMRGIAF